MLYVAISELNPAVYNPRKWSKKATDDLTDSIKRFGLIDPIIVNKARGNTVVGGHFRLHVAKKLGYTEVPCVFVSIEDERQEKELNLRLNKNSGDWDWSLLRDWETSLLQEAGFDDAELKETMDQVLEPVREDDFDATATLEAKETKVKPGDVWQLGTHRLMCGDSTKLEDVEKLMNGKKADMVFTDPPFPNNSGILEDMIIGIEESFLLARSMCPGDMYWFWDNITEPPFSETVVARHVWHKTNGWQANHWEAINLFDGKTKRRESLVFSEANVGGSNRREEQGNHPTPKPISLCEIFVKKGNTILDLFAGSGSTLIACEQTKRICYTMELDPKYCDVVIARWEKLTNQTAIKL